MKRELKRILAFFAMSLPFASSANALWDCSALHDDIYELVESGGLRPNRVLSDFSYDQNTGDLCFYDAEKKDNDDPRIYVWSVYGVGDAGPHLVMKEKAYCDGVSAYYHLPYAYDIGDPRIGGVEIEEFDKVHPFVEKKEKKGSKRCIPDADYHMYYAYKKGYNNPVFAPKAMYYMEDGEKKDYYDNFAVNGYSKTLGDLRYYPKRPSVVNNSPRYSSRFAVGRTFASYFYDSQNQTHAVTSYKYDLYEKPVQRFDYVNGFDSIQVGVSVLSREDFRVAFQYKLDSAEWNTFFLTDTVKAARDKPVNVLAPQIGLRYFNAEKVDIRGVVLAKNEMKANSAYLNDSVLRVDSDLKFSYNDVNYIVIAHKITLNMTGTKVQIRDPDIQYNTKVVDKSKDDKSKDGKSMASKYLSINLDSSIVYTAEITSPYDVEYVLLANVQSEAYGNFMKWYPSDEGVRVKKSLLTDGYKISIPIDMKDFGKADHVTFKLIAAPLLNGVVSDHAESDTIGVKIMRTVDFQVSGEGSIISRGGKSTHYSSMTSGSLEFENLSELYLRAEPAAGNKFVCWVINDGKCSTTDDIVKQIYVDSAMTVQARFASVESSYNFALSVVGETQYENGAMVKKTYSAGKGPVVVPYTSLYKKSSVISLEMEGSVSLEFLKNKSGSGYSTSRSAFLHYRTNTDPEWRAYSFTSRIIFKQDSLTGRSKTVEFKLPTCAEEDSEGRIDILCSDLKAATEMELKVLGVLANEDTVGYSNSIYLEIQNLNFAWLFRVVADNGYAFYDQNIVNGNVFHLEYEDSHGNTGVINNWNDSAYFPAGEMVKFTPVIGYEYDFKDWFISVGAVPDDPDLDKPYSSDSSITLKMDNNLAISTFIKKRQDIPVSITSVNDLNAGLKDLKFDVSSAHGFRFDTDTLFYLHKGSSLYAVNALDSALIPGDYTVTFNLVFSGSERDYKFLCNKTMPHSVDGKLDYFAPVAVQFLGDTLVAPKLENCAETAGMLKFKFSKNFTVKDTSYIVKFYDVENKQIGKDLKIAFSQTPSAPNVTISKKNNEKMSYKYHWLPEIESAARNVEYHAVLDSFATPYVIKAAAGDTNGNVYGAGTYAYGDSVALAAVAKTGYKFKSWSDDPNAKEVRFLAVNGDTSVVAYFVKVDASSSSSATSSSSGTMSSSSSEDKNAVGTFAKIPDFHLVAFNKSIIVYSAAMGANVIVLDMQGRIIATTQIHAPSVIIDVPQSGAYLVSINRKTQKVLVK